MLFDLVQERLGAFYGLSDKDVLFDVLVTLDCHLCGDTRWQVRDVDPDGPTVDGLPIDVDSQFGFIHRYAGASTGLTLSAETGPSPRILSTARRRR